MYIKKQHFFFLWFRVNLFVSILMRLVSLLVLTLKLTYWKNRELYVKLKMNVHSIFSIKYFAEHLQNKRVNKLMIFIINI